MLKQHSSNHLALWDQLNPTLPLQDTLQSQVKWAGKTILLLFPWPYAKRLEIAVAVQQANQRFFALPSLSLHSCYHLWHSFRSTWLCLLNWLCGKMIILCCVLGDICIVTHTAVILAPFSPFWCGKFQSMKLMERAVIQSISSGCYWVVSVLRWFPFW